MTNIYSQGYSGPVQDIGVNSYVVPRYKIIKKIVLKLMPYLAEDRHKYTSKSEFSI